MSGSGVNLRVERAKPDQIAEAVYVLTKPSYGDNARRLAEAISKTDPLHTLDQILEHLSERPGR